MWLLASTMLTGFSFGPPGKWTNPQPSLGGSAQSRSCARVRCCVVRAPVRICPWCSLFLVMNYSNIFTVYIYIEII